VTCPDFMSGWPGYENIYANEFEYEYQQYGIQLPVDGTRTVPSNLITVEWRSIANCAMQGLYRVYYDDTFHIHIKLVRSSK